VARRKKLLLHRHPPLRLLPWPHLLLLLLLLLLTLLATLPRRLLTLLLTLPRLLLPSKLYSFKQKSHLRVAFLLLRVVGSGRRSERLGGFKSDFRQN
jgi:hypothetical protein